MNSCPACFALKFVQYLSRDVIDVKALAVSKTAEQTNAHRISLFGVSFNLQIR